MKLFNNIKGIHTVYSSWASMKKHIKPIAEARESGDVQKEKETIVEALNDWTPILVDAFQLDIQVIHPERLPKDGPVVYVANHQSYSDIFIFLHVVPHQLGFITKSELKKVPVLGKWIERIRGIFIDRRDVRASLKAINLGADYLKSGFSLAIFPEGTRSRSREMRPFKPGALKLATKAKATIIPVTLDGGYRVFEEKKELVKGVKVKMLIHQPIETKDLSRQELAELPTKVESIIREGLDELENKDIR